MLENGPPGTVKKIPARQRDISKHFREQKRWKCEGGFQGPLLNAAQYIRSCTRQNHAMETIKRSGFYRAQTQILPPWRCNNFKKRRGTLRMSKERAPCLVDPLTVDGGGGGVRTRCLFPIYFWKVGGLLRVIVVPGSGFRVSGSGWRCATEQVLSSLCWVDPSRR